jgi:hypothetical protein
MAAVVAVNPMNVAQQSKPSIEKRPNAVDPLLSESARIERYESGEVLDKRLKAEFGRSTDSIAAFQELQDALSSSSASCEYELERAWRHTCEALLKLQNELLEEGRLLSSVRLKLGPLQLGQTLLHLAVLWKLYQRPEYSVVHLLLRLEPPLLCATYEGHLYRDENLLHMAVAHGDGKLVLELAAFALQPRAGFAGPDVVGGAYLHGDSADDEILESLKLGRPAASGISGSSSSSSLVSTRLPSISTCGRRRGTEPIARMTCLVSRICSPFGPTTLTRPGPARLPCPCTWSTLFFLSKKVTPPAFC